MPWFYYVGRLIVRTLLLLFTRWQIKGRENIPSQGALLIVANHLHLADPPLLVVSLSRKVVFMTKKELFHFRVIGYFVRGFGAFPVHRGQLDRKALRQVHQLFADGKALVMFPEGTRSKSVQLQHASSGAALVALRGGVPILPVGISGTEKIKGMFWMMHRPRITVNIGCPFYLPPVNSPLTKVELSKFTTLIMEHIAELLPPQYRGIYAGQGD